MNFNDEIEKINPVNISDEEFDRHNIPKNVRKSIAFYNRAIRNLKIRCVELAITDLKKSVSLNSDFSEAIKLLGLCYFCKKDYNKAERCFKKLAQYDIYTVLANKYLQEMKAYKTITKTLDTMRNSDFKSDDYMNIDRASRVFRHNNKIKRFKNSRKKLVVSFLAAVIMITISGLAYNKYPIIKNTFNKTEKTGAKEDKELKKQKAAIEKNRELDEENKILQENLGATKLELENYKNKNNVISVLNDAEKYYSDGNYEKALDNLMTLKSLKLDDAEKSRYDKLWNTIKTNDVWTIYNQGNKLYKQGNYKEALPKLLRVQQIAPELDIMPWVLYQIGTCFKEVNDKNNALLFFERVRDNYPNTEYAGYSEGMISEINNK